ncbi:FAD-dependent oxidoreductase [Oscillibacter valericigenes]|uniref:FAD-dependent oxidoreductase n=1 Tax=Oscillibacter valericigenes TaxID=351091 RepID=UPI001F2F1897|nr:FAD-dependent oxidoreductase [Oscillibacter valericigenes]
MSNYDPHPYQIPEDMPKREIILKLGQMITNRMGRKITYEDAEYWGLQGIVTDEMAEVALKMEVRKPKTLAQIAKLTGKDPEHLEKLLFEMCMVGLIEYNWEDLDGKNPNHEKRYVVPLFVPGSAEFTNMNAKQLEEHPELGKFFERMSFEALERVTPMVPPGGAGIGMHVIPVEKAIPTESQSISIEHISHWLDKYEGQYAKSPCSCRLSRRTFDEGCADDPEDWCIAVGDMANYIVETNRGSYITKEEALEIFRKAEDNGFVHQITNIDGEQKIFGICNCNVNVCYALRTSQLFNTPNLSRSAYVAKVEPENCVACGRCVEYCPAGAVKLGQKLCTKDGPVVYPRHELPDAAKWGPEKWDVDYRDNNRINCYDTGTSPCKTACPAHIAVQGYLKLAAQGKFTEALQLIKRENPFPAVCGRICNRRCEDACTRGTVDQAVAIDEVKRFIAQQDLDSATRFIPPVVTPTLKGGFSQKIAVIGAGPAGMSCAYYLAEKGYKPTVFDKAARPGGMLMNGIPSFRLEKDVVDAEIDVLREMGVEFRCGVEVGKDVTIQQLREEGYQGFYVAIGLQSGGRLNIPGDDAQGVTAGIDFTKQVNLEGPQKLEGKVVVIGGGNIACDVARTAVRCGAEVTMYCLEGYDDMPCGEEDRSECEKDGITIRAGCGPVEITSADGKCTGITFRKCLSVKNAEGRFAPTFDDSVTETADCATVLYCIGQKADWGQLLTGTRVELNPNGTVKADPLTLQTAEPDIFVGGDAYTGQKFAIDAIAAGKEGAVSLHRFVQPHSSLTIGRNRRQFIELDKKNLDIGSYDDTPRQRPGYNEALRKTFSDERTGFTAEQVKIETARCLGCGASVVDPNKCIGCGVCTTKCGFDAIHLFRERPECSTMVPIEDKLKAVFPYMVKRGLKIKFGKKA